MTRFSDTPFVMKWLCALGALAMFIICGANGFLAVSGQVTGRVVYSEGTRVVISREEVTKEKDPEKFNETLGKYWFYSLWTFLLLIVFITFFRKLK